MDTDYDAIVLGTGLKECIISGLLSVDGLKVELWPDTYYGLMVVLSKVSKGTSAGSAYRPEQLLWGRQRFSEPRTGTFKQDLSVFGCGM